MPTLYSMCSNCANANIFLQLSLSTWFQSISPASNYGLFPNISIPLYLRECISWVNFKSQLYGKQCFLSWRIPAKLTNRLNKCTLRFNSPKLNVLNFGGCLAEKQLLEGSFSATAPIDWKSSLTSGGIQKHIYCF